MTVTAQRFRVSRGHVLDLLRQAERGGLLARDGKESWRILQAMREEISAMLAAMYLGYGTAVRAATA